MTSDHSPSDFQSLWQRQPGEPQGIDPENFRRDMQKFERKIMRRNLREYAAGAIVVSAFGYYIYLFPLLLIRIGCALLIVGTLYVMYELRRRASAVPAPVEFALTSCVEFQRRQLERQRCALRSVWSWYLLPFVPGMLVFLCGLYWLAMRTALAAGRHFDSQMAVASLGLTLAAVAAVFIAIWKLNQWAADKLQVQMDELDALMRDPG